jgi:hypothetical protein
MKKAKDKPEDDNETNFVGAKKDNREKKGKKEKQKCELTRISRKVFAVFALAVRELLANKVNASAEEIGREGVVRWKLGPCGIFVFLLCARVIRAAQRPIHPPFILFYVFLSPVPCPLLSLSPIDVKDVLSLVAPEQSTPICPKSRLRTFLLLPKLSTHIKLKKHLNSLCNSFEIILLRR